MFPSFYCWYILIYISAFYVFMLLLLSSSTSYGPMGLVRYWVIVTNASNKSFTSPHFGTSTDMSQPLSPLSRFAKNVLPYKTQFLSLTVSFERTQTKTNNCTTIYLRSQYTLFATTFHIFYPFYPTLLFQTTIVDHYKTTDPIR